MTAPPFAYFGGKTLLARRIADLLPAHEHYVEPYAGSLSVLLAKPPSRLETVNDLDGDLMTFWRVLRNEPAELARVCQATPHSRSEHAAAAQWVTASTDARRPLPDLEVARLVWVTLSQGRGGQLRQNGWRHYVNPINPNGGRVSMPANLDSYVARLEAVAGRLHRVSLECVPAMDLITKYGSYPGVLLYVDPPYLAGTRSSIQRYRHEMLDEQSHLDLAAALHRCRAAVVLSGYDSPLYAEVYAGWETVRIDTNTTQGGSKGERTEVLWCNRAAAPDLFSIGGVA